VVGEIYLAKIYFTDLSQYKIRPVLVIKEMGDDRICLQLTSKYDNERIKLEKSDLTDGTLKRDSLVVVPKNFTLHRKILFKYIGRISDKKLSEIYDIFCHDIGCIKYR